MKIEISIGEALDKLSILRIKLEKITDPNKIINIRKEHDHISSKCQDILQDNIAILYIDLIKVNTSLWNIEDKIRIKEKNKIFDHEFIDLARSVYITNDHRAKIKKQINLLTNSNFIEEKSYENY